MAADMTLWLSIPLTVAILVILLAGACLVGLITQSRDRACCPCVHCSRWRSSDGEA